MKSGFGILTSEHFTRLDCWTIDSIFSVGYEPYQSTDVS